jgi:hypothetical protein
MAWHERARAFRALSLLGVTGALGLAARVAPAQTVGPAPTDTTAAPAPAPPAASSAAPHVVVPATGYGWSAHPAKRPRTGARLKIRANAPPSDAHPNGTVIPGFETLADGSSRVFVQMPQPTTYTAKVAKGTLTYVLKGVHIDRRNNMNALVTVHFNTPVTSARLVPHGGDLWLIVDLRANVQPTVAMDATKDGGAMLRVEFPKGDYLGGASPPPPAAPAPAPASSGSPPSGS